MTATIRVAREEDDRALQALDAATWSWAVSPSPAPPDDRPFFGATTNPEDVLVAVVDGVIAGYVRLGRPTSLASNHHVLAVHGLAVDPAFRRRAIGRLLVDAAAREASARGARRLTLHVLSPNTAARAFYASCGFEVEGILRQEFVLEGRYVDDVLMALDLRAQ